MENTKYIIDKRFTTRAARSERILEIAEAFGIGLEDKEFVIFDNLELKVKQGDIVYITGQSGSGKSLLLRELEKQMSERGMKVANLDKIELPEIPLIDQIGKDTNDAIRILSTAGINDAYLLIRKPSELSDGQRYRFRLAKAIETDADVWVADEFLAVLDRVAAKVISFSIQKTARRTGKTVIVATTHTDLKEDLQPDLYINKKYREKILIEAKPTPTTGFVQALSLRPQPSVTVTTTNPPPTYPKPPAPPPPRVIREDVCIVDPNIGIE